MVTKSKLKTNHLNLKSRIFNLKSRWLIAFCLISGAISLFPSTGFSQTQTPVSIQYGYDKLNRLTSVTCTDGKNTYTITYGYDAVGNRISMDVQKGGRGDVSPFSRGVPSPRSPR